MAGGVANLGVRPMFEPPKELLETWIFDWSGDLYGQTLEVQLVEWLRPELRLESLDALKAQIGADEQQARRILDLETAQTTNCAASSLTSSRA